MHYYHVASISCYSSRAHPQTTDFFHFVEVVQDSRRTKYYFHCRLSIDHGWCPQTDARTKPAATVTLHYSEQGGGSIPALWTSLRKLLILFSSAGEPKCQQKKQRNEDQSEPYVKFAGVPFRLKKLCSHKPSHDPKQNIFFSCKNKERLHTQICSYTSIFIPPQYYLTQQVEEMAK